MKSFAAYYLRGLVYAIGFFIVVAIFTGLMAFTASFPYIGIPVIILVILPLLFGAIHEEA